MAPGGGGLRVSNDASGLPRAGCVPDGTQEPPPAVRTVPMEARWQYHFRLVLLGDSTVGKSSLLRRYTDDVFADRLEHTVGVDFHVRLVEVEPGVPVRLQLWDTAGHERYRSVTRSYYRNAAGGLLLFDVANRASFENVPRWHREVMDKVKPFGIVFLVVGHKSDLVAERQVTAEEGARLASSLGARYVETSAKSDSNVALAVQLLTQDIYEAVKRGAMGPSPEWEGVKIRMPAGPGQ